MKIEIILLFSIRDIEKTTSHARQRTILLNGTTKEKAEVKHTKHWSILQNKMSKTFENAYMKKKLKLFFKNLKPKTDWILIEPNWKFLMLYEKSN